MLRGASVTAAFDGWIGNRTSLREALGLGDNAEDVALYLAAYQRWGDASDDHINGNYAAAIVDEGGAWARLSRSAFNAPPIHYRLSEEHCVAGSLVSVLATLPGAARLHPELAQVARGLAGDRSHPRSGWYRHTGRVAKGEAVRITAGSDEVWPVWRYSAPKHGPRQGKLADDSVLSTAQELLEEAVAGAAGRGTRVALALSGGLDSGLVASFLAQQNQGAAITALTMAPAKEWIAAPRPGYVADESSGAASIADQLGIAHHEIVINSSGPFDEHFARTLEKAGCAPVAIGLAPFLQTLARSAHQNDAQILMGADEGNSGISADGQWGYRELFLRLRWRELWLALRHRPRDPRPIWRKFVSLVVRGSARKLDIARFLSARGLRFESADEYGLVDGPGLDHFRERETPMHPRRVREELLAQSDDGAAEVAKAVEAVHGVPYRDPMAYPPLLEFCLSLPTRQFLRRGQTRYLARRLAEGRLPDAARMSHDHGVTDADWPLRVTRDRAALLAELEKMRADEDLSSLLDLSGMSDRLVRWDGKQPVDPLAAMALSYCLPAAIAAGRVIARAKGRNDL
ncbi:asparagine synthase-related protein [Qipengyuania flava]|uniref:asparagine synthase-related protein n=1 Tax=Qipengyuania flava TaxID=192812 RepID=UPI001C63128A|nr:asparagine synthase C-terminal domain-containing protein [Qipengyuania flava]QYJ07390.1 asparagine synthase C-terminal domain-containing protein [Qipengyuania flava]